MNTKISFAVIVFLCFFLIKNNTNAQNNAPQVSNAKYFDVSPRLRDVKIGLPILRTKKDKVENVKDEQEWRENKEYLRPEEPFADDPVRQSQNGKAPSTTIGLNIEGVGNRNEVYPPDPNGDIGGDYYFQQVNCSFAIYNRAGTRVFGPANNSTLWDGFIGPWTGQNDGDGIVMYDEQADRWFASQFSIIEGLDTSYHQLIAISQTNDPTGAWYRYAYEFDDFNDYPKFGVWPDGYYGSFNMPGYAMVAVFERSKMLAGDPTARMQTFKHNGVWSFLPSDCDGIPPPAGAPNLFSRCFDNNFGSSEDRIKIWEFHTDWTNTNNTTFDLVSTLIPEPYNCVICNTGRWQCVQQPGTDMKLEALSGQLMNRLQYRNFGSYKTLVANLTTRIDSCKSGIRWFEFRNSGSGWAIYQQGTYAPDNNFRWAGSIAMNAAGDIGLAYTVSGTSLYPSIRFTGRKTTDPLGQMTIAETTIQAGIGSQTGFYRRWGDYSTLAVDPVDNITFWFNHEYYSSTSNIDWQTRIANFNLNTAAYCQAGSMNHDNEYISNVHIGTIDHSSFRDPFGYGDYTTVSTALPKGSPSSITVTIGSPGYYDFGGIWVDWNEDGDFDDASEQISPITGSMGLGPYTAQIIPPLDTPEGNKRLRVRVNYMSEPSACGFTTYGETEDYTISIVAPTVNVWTGNYSGLWESNNNWSLGHVPVASENVLVPSSTFNSPWLHSIAAECNNITINPGVLFDIFDGSLHVAGNMTMYGQLMMEHAAAELTVDGNITFGSGSTANMYAYANINIAGNWTFAAGSNVQLTNGAVTFTGNSPSIIYCNG
ncbi:MAG: GEVED domain-containing protein, partial [Bacteroidales bacterium]